MPKIKTIKNNTMKKIILAVLAFMSISTMAQDFQWVKDFSENDPATFEIADINHIFVYQKLKL